MILQSLGEFAHYAQLYRKCHSAATLNGHFKYNYHSVAFPGGFSSATFFASKSCASCTVSDPCSFGFLAFTKTFVSLTKGGDLRFQEGHPMHYCFCAFRKLINCINRRRRGAILERTLCGSCGINLPPIKPPCMFFSAIEAKKASRNARRNSTLLTCVMCGRIEYSICRPYAFFTGPKHPTSSGWN